MVVVSEKEEEELEKEEGMEVDEAWTPGRAGSRKPIDL